MPSFEFFSKPLPLAGLYVVTAIVYYLSLFWRHSAGKKAGNLEEALSMIFVPVALVGFFLAALVATPYFWLFPERHRNLVDMEGTDEERRRLERYREYRSRVGVAGRVAELFGWRPFDKPSDDFLNGNDLKN